MKTTVTKTFKDTYESLVSITCNKCGTIIQPKNKKDYFWLDKMQTVELEWGYGSNHDATTWKFDLCEDCIEDLIDTFQIPVEIIELF